MAGAAGSDLSALVATERRLGERLARAAAEARRLVDEARHAAEADAAALEAELERALTTLRAEAAAERERRLAATADEGRRAAARFDDGRGGCGRHRGEDSRVDKIVTDRYLMDSGAAVNDSGWQRSKPAALGIEMIPKGA